MRMVFIVMLDRHCKVMQCRSYIRFRHERDVVFLHRFHEPFCHSIALRATDCHRAGLQIQLPGELPCFMSSISRTVISQPLDWPFRSFIAKAFFYRSWHHILHCRFIVTSRACCPVYGFTNATIQCERDTQFCAISCPSKIPVISKLELVSDIYPGLSLILRYIHCLAFQGAGSTHY